MRFRCPRATNQHFVASPERIQPPEPTNMLFELRVAISKIPLVPSQHKAARAIDHARIVKCCFVKLINEIVGNTDIIHMAEIGLQ